MMAQSVAALLVLGGVFCTFFLSVICLLAYWARPRIEFKWLRDRYRADAQMPEPNWVFIGNTGTLFETGTLTLKSNQSTFHTCLLIAFSARGLCLKLNPEHGATGFLPPVCIPWEFVQCVSHSKFGFFKADFTISGLEKGRTIELHVESRDQKVGGMHRTVSCGESCDIGL